MATCEVCGNQYDTAMQITVAGAQHVFDCFECATAEGVRGAADRVDREPVGAIG
jgi:ribosome-binding protein aMBF1 (putative translation factor)